MSGPCRIPLGLYEETSGLLLILWCKRAHYLAEWKNRVQSPVKISFYPHKLPTLSTLVSFEIYHESPTMTEEATSKTGTSSYLTLLRGLFYLNANAIQWI